MMKLTVKEQEYLSKGQLYTLKVISGEVYVLVNLGTKRQVKVNKAELIKNISNGSVLVNNIYLRKTSKGGLSIVCKEPEKVKRMEAKPTEQVKKVEDRHKDKVHYQGELGDFWYDTTEFELIDILHLGGGYSRICLHYKGEKIRGIEIPEGVTYCGWMFYACKSLKEAPAIPKGVEDCEGMFMNCTSLKEAPEIPKGVKDCYAMFYDCTSLVEVPEIPSSVINCGWMFAYCESLKEAPAIPSSVTYCGFMFADCSEEVRKQGEYNLEHRV